MRILVIGRGETTGVLSAIFPGRTDFRIARFGTTEEAVEVIDGSEPALALLHVDQDSLAALDRLHLLTERGARVVVLAGDISTMLRAASFDAGATDVVFPPITTRRIEAAVLSLLGRPARRETRFQATTPAILGAHAPGAPTFRGTVLDLSRGGFRARI
ncbi:MAG TPA: hypothetical protein VMV18_08200, partial [bacterium]|nr:hypothetical protein [bacterium]